MGCGHDAVGLGLGLWGFAAVVTSRAGHGCRALPTTTREEDLGRDLSPSPGGSATWVHPRMSCGGWAQPGWPS
jgi:hypothetical protein